jgi:hypothetical protein
MPRIFSERALPAEERDKNGTERFLLTISRKPRKPVLFDMEIGYSINNGTPSVEFSYLPGGGGGV